MATLPPGFWDGERRRLAAEMGDTVMKILIAGGTSGVEALPQAATALVNWDIFNQHALDWLNLFMGETPVAPPFVDKIGWEWARGLTDTTRRDVMGEINAWVQSGEPLPELEKRLARIPTFSANRAKQTAVTEVTRIYASGNLMAWDASGVVGAKRWRTAVDERVCPICGPMHMTIVEIDQDWTFTQEMRDANHELDRALKSLNMTAFTAPPAHVNCRCWLSPVVLEAHTPEQIQDQSFNKPQAPIEVVTGPPAFSNYADARTWAEQSANLTQEQRDAIRLYTGDDREYGYKQINGALYTEIDGEQLIKLQPDLERQANVLSSALEQMPRYDGTTYRGMNFGPFGTEQRQQMLDGFARAQELGESVNMPAFTSTSTSQKTAQKFTNKRYGISFEIEGIDGRVIASESAYKKESEVLFNMGSRFDVVSVGKDRSGFMRVVLRQVLGG